MFEQPCQREPLPFKSGNMEEQKQANYDLRKTIKAAVNIAASLPEELNEFYGRFEAHNTAGTDRAPAADEEAVSTLSVSVEDVTRSFHQVSIRKAVGSDGIPGHF